MLGFGIWVIMVVCLHFDKVMSLDLFGANRGTTIAINSSTFPSLKMRTENPFFLHF